MKTVVGEALDEFRLRTDIVQPEGGNMKVTTDTWQDLANAIVAQAAEDYREALTVLKDFPEDQGAKSMKRDVERFYGSVYYTLMTKVDPQYILSRIRAEVGV